jgi:anaerobic selenocysteine-containing dehydrogenase
MNAYGSPNLILDGTNETWRAAWVYVAGAERAPAVDLPNSDFILSFGHELFETDGHPVWQSKAWGQLRSPTVARPASLVYVGARISPSAARADRRIAIHPGSEGALVLGLIHVLLIEDLVDHRFIDRWLADYRAAGEDSGSSGDFESLVRHHHGPEEVSRVTGASVGDILRLGRAFGAAERPVAIVGPSPLHGPEGLATAMAVVALNLLVGAVGRPGGYVAAGRAPLTPPPAIPVDATGRRGLSAARVDGAGVESLPVIRHRPAGLVAALAERKPYPIEVLLMHGVNPTHEWPDGQRFASALANVPLVVATARVPDDTAALADLILPECSFLESSDLVPSIHGLPLDYVGLQQAAVRPLFESRPFEDIWFALARAIGHPVAGVIPPGSYADWLPQAAAGLREAGRGTLASGESDARLARFVEARGWRAQGPGSPDAFWAALAAGGAWVDTPAVDHSPAEVLGPGVDRFRLWPERLVREMTRLRGRAPGKEDFYAGAGSSPAAPPEAGRGDYPLDLLLFDVNTLWRGRTAVTPLLLELTGAREDIAWDSWVEIHPDTAARHGVRSGDRVRLESAIGGFAVRARVAPLVPPDAVAMPRGLGHRHFGRFASGVGANPAALVALRLDAWTGVAMLPTRVRLAAARV